jgi:katanin p60 ATPase-containing subunit A1
LIDEAQLSGDFIVCDNVDLDTLYLEYSSFYEVKFGKKPRFVKRVDQIQNPLKSQVSNSSLTTSESKISLSKRRASMKTEQHPPVKNVDSTDYIRVSSLTTSSSTPIENNGNLSPIPLKPLSFLSSNTISDDEFFLCHPSDWKAMTEMIYKDIVRRDLCVKWDQIVGLDDAKQILQESVILPLKYPQIFRQVQTWKGKPNQKFSL